jgi:hypothetical protein
METKRRPGRPIGSDVRQNMIEILFKHKELHGYELYKIYCDLFPKVSQRLIYYHLKRGVSLNEFRVVRVHKKEGNYSWGGSVENIIYSIGLSAKPIGKLIK